MSTDVVWIRWLGSACLVAAMFLLRGGVEAAADDRIDPRAVLGEAVDEWWGLVDEPERNYLHLDLVEELARAGKFDEARRVARAMEDRFGKARGLGTIAAWEARAGDVAAAMRTVAEIGGPNGQYERELAIQHVATARADAGDVAGAAESIRAHLNPKDAAHAIARLMARRIEAGDADGAWMAEPVLDTLPIAPDAKAAALERVAYVLALFGDLEGATRILNEAYGAPRIRWSIASGRADAGDLVGAARFARPILGLEGHWNFEASARMYLVRDLAARGEIVEAEAILDGPWKGPPYGVITFASFPLDVDPDRDEAAFALAEAYAVDGDVEGARARLAGFVGGNAVGGLLRLADGREREGDHAAAEWFLAAAERSAEATRDWVARLDLAATQFRLGRREAANASYKRALSELPPGEQKRVVLARAEAGDVEGALRMADSIAEPESRDRARAVIAARLAYRSQADEALDAARRIDDPAYRATALAQVGKGLADRGDPGRGLSACREAAGVADSVQAIPPEVARIVAHGWASTAAGLPEAHAWALRLPGKGARASALLGVVQGALGRRLDFFWPRHSPYLTPPRRTWPPSARWGFEPAAGSSRSLASTNAIAGA